MTNLNDVQVNIIVSLKGKNKLAALDSAMRGLITVQTGLRQQFGKTINGLNHLQTAAGAASKAVNATAKAAKAATTAQAAAARAAQAAARAQAAAVKAQQGGLKGLGYRLGEIEKKYDALFRASFRLQLVGAELLLVGKRTLTMLADLASEWGKFEFMVNRAAGAVQLFKGQSEGMDSLYQNLINRILETSKVLRLFPAEDVAKATYYWASTTGQAVQSLNDMRNAVDAVNPIMKIAAMTQTDYEVAIKGVYSILVQYNLSLSQTADVTQKLFLAAQRTALEFPDLINSFKMVGPIAKSLGITFDNVNELLAQLGDAGIRGTMSGRALRQMFIKLTKPTAAAAALLDELYLSTKGIEDTFNNVEFPDGEFAGTTHYINNLALALKDADMLYKNFVLGSITTSNELPALTALVQQQIDVLNDVPGATKHVKEGLDDSAYAAEQFAKSWEMLANSWNGVVARLSRGVEVIRLKLGQQLATALEPIITQLTKVIDRIERWVSENPAIIEFIGKLTMLAGVLLTVAGGAFILSGALMGVAAGFGFVVEAIGTTLPRVLGIVGVLAALAAAVYDNFARIQRTLIPALTRLGDALGINRGGLEGLVEWFGEMRESVKLLADMLVKFLITALTTIVDMATALARSPLRPVIEAIGKALMIAFALRTVTTVLMLRQGLNLLMAACAKVMVSLWGMRMAANGVTLSFRGLAVAFRGLMLAAPLAAITALVLFFETIMAFKNPVSDFINDLLKNFRDLKSEIADFAATVGSGGDEFVGWLENTARSSAEVQANMKAIADEKARLESQKTLNPFQMWANDISNLSHGIDFSHLFSAADPEEAVQARTLEMTKQIEAVAQANGVSTATVKASMDSVRTNYKGNYSQMLGYAEAFFKFNADGAKATPAAIRDAWEELRKKGLAGNITLDEMFRKNLDPSEWAQMLTDRSAMAQLEKARLLLAENMVPQGMEILNALKRNEAGLGPDMQRRVENLFSSVPKGVTAAFEEAETAASEGPAALFSAMEAAFSKVGDYSERIKALMKPAQGKGVTAQSLITTVFHGLTAKSLAGELNSKFLLVRQAAGAHADELFEMFATGITSMTNGEKTRVAQYIQQKLFNVVKDGIVPDKIDGVAISSEVRQYLQEVYNWAVGTAVDFEPKAVHTGKPKADAQGIAGGLHRGGGVGWKKGVDAAVEYKRQAWLGFERTLNETKDTPSVDVSKGAIGFLVSPVVSSFVSAESIAAVVQSVKTGVTDPIVATTGMLSAGGESAPMYRGGVNAVQSWINGVNSMLPEVQSVGTIIAGALADPTVGNSPPKMGPLKHIDRGGANIASAWIGGWKSKAGEAASAASAMAGRMSSALADHSATLNADSKVSMSTDSSRKVTVDIKVSSPDGSANKMTQQQIMTALRSGGLISNIERLATVD